MSEKRVLVIDKDKFEENWLNLTQKQRSFLVNVESALKQSSPGNLLASFGGRVIKARLAGNRTYLSDIPAKIRGNLENNQPVTVLIVEDK